MNSYEWYIDGPNTHGIVGLASVGRESDEWGVPCNFSGIGPDEIFTGTATECVKHLRGKGYNGLETDDDELQREWLVYDSTQELQDWMNQLRDDEPHYVGGMTLREDRIRNQNEE